MALDTGRVNKILFNMFEREAPLHPKEKELLEKIRELYTVQLGIINLIERKQSYVAARAQSDNRKH